MPVPRIVARYRAVLNDVYQVAAAGSQGVFLTNQGNIYVFGRNSQKILTADNETYFYIPQDNSKEFLTYANNNTADKSTRFTHVGSSLANLYLVTDGM